MGHKIKIRFENKYFEIFAKSIIFYILFRNHFQINNLPSLFFLDSTVCRAVCMSEFHVFVSICIERNEIKKKENRKSRATYYNV